MWKQLRKKNAFSVQIRALLHNNISEWIYTYSDLQIIPIKISILKHNPVEVIFHNKFFFIIHNIISDELKD